MSGSTLISAATVELAPEKLYYKKDIDEFAALGTMAFEVVPADRSKKPKSYDQAESKKAVGKKTLTKDPLQSGILPSCAYVELPILKCPAPVQPVCPMEEGDMMSEIEVDRVPSSSKGKQRVDVTNPEASSEKPQPQHKYASELTNEVDPESVFQKLLSQPVTLKLGEILGLSFELSHQFQIATRSQQIPVQQMMTSNAEVL